MFFFKTGIIIQKVVPETFHKIQCPTRECQVPIKKNQRTVVAPLVAIAPYGIATKKTPTFDGSTLDMSVMQPLESNDFTLKCRKLNLAYCMIKHFTTDEDNL